MEEIRCADYERLAVKESSDVGWREVSKTARIPAPIMKLPLPLLRHTFLMLNRENGKTVKRR